MLDIACGVEIYSIVLYSVLQTSINIQIETHGYSLVTPLNCGKSLPKSLPIFASTSESSSIQTAELIVKWHTIFKMGSHDHSPHTFGSDAETQVRCWQLCDISMHL